jgi:hypothetical protein
MLKDIINQYNNSSFNSKMQIKLSIISYVVFQILVLLFLCDLCKNPEKYLTTFR